MNEKNPNRFKLNSRGALLAVISAALANPALANTGRVDFTIGNVNVTNASGRVQPLTKGAEVRSGDKVSSGADGRAQIRFSDGAYVSLQPNTEFDIKEYRYNGRTDGSESAIFGLFKGALRTVTGLVGRVNRNKYQITTPTATIGIRGTGGIIQVGSDGSTLVTGTSGIWSLSNNGGTLDIPAGTAGFAGSNRNVAPQQSNEGPVIPPPPSQTQEQTTLVTGNNVSPQGTPVGPVLVTGTGYTVSESGRVSTPSTTAGQDAVFDQNGALTQFGGALRTGTTVALLSGTQNEFNTNGILAWSRWTGDVAVTPPTGGTTITTFGPNQGLHTIVGLPTPPASMPTSGTFTYTLIGATAPTFADGRTGPGTFKGQFVGDFTSGKVGLDFAAIMPNKTYAFTTTGFTLGGPNPNSPITISGSNFSGSIINPITSPCASCIASISGFFAGVGAANAGMVYTINDTTGGGGVVNGAAAFQR